MEWISVEERLPDTSDEEGCTSVYVLVTDGKYIEIGQYIFKPRSYGCAVDDDWQKATCGPQPHWHPDEDGSCFKDGDKCFGSIEIFDITHWMPFPKPPREEES